MERIQKGRGFEPVPPSADVRHLSYRGDPISPPGGIAKDYAGGWEPDYENTFLANCADPGAAKRFPKGFWEGRYRKLNTRKGPLYHTPAEPPPYIF